MSNYEQRAEKRQQQLEEAGFIDSEGFGFYDPISGEERWWHKSDEVGISSDNLEGYILIDGDGDPIRTMGSRMSLEDAIMQAFNYLGM